MDITRRKKLDMEQEDELLEKISSRLKIAIDEITKDYPDLFVITGAALVEKSIGFTMVIGTASRQDILANLNQINEGVRKDVLPYCTSGGRTDDISLAENTEKEFFESRKEGNA